VLRLGPAGRTRTVTPGSGWPLPMLGDRAGELADARAGEFPGGHQVGPRADQLGTAGRRAGLAQDLRRQVGVQASAKAASTMPCSEATAPVTIGEALLVPAKPAVYHSVSGPPCRSP
jgi:hypothetical protein